MIKSSLIVACLLVIITAMSSCGSTRKLQYMQGAFDTARLSVYNIPQPIIQKGDLLSISVNSESPAASAVYNQGTVTTPAATAGTLSGAPASTGVTGGGYLVDPNGNIQFQSLGDVHVEGLTKLQLTALLDSALQVYLTKPYCTVRFLNYKITLIGDVTRPGVYAIPSEQVTLLEAIGLAGDLNITARRDNVLVMREQNGKRQWGRIDLTSPDILASPFYQLQQNDLVYVDFTRSKAAAGDQVTARNISIAATVVSTLAIIYSILKK